jgi:hypothetical protein
MARPKRFELLTPRFVVWCSIQLSYGREGAVHSARLRRLQGGFVSHRRQNGKPLPRAPLRQGAALGVHNLDHADAGARRPVPAGGEHVLDVDGGPGDHRLDPAIAAVAHPACERATAGLGFDEGAKADTLDARR